MNGNSRLELEDDPQRIARLLAQAHGTDETGGRGYGQAVYGVRCRKVDDRTVRALESKDLGSRGARQRESQHGTVRCR